MKQIYGSPRIVKELRDRGLPAGSMKPKLIEGEKQGEGHPQIVGILKEAESGIAMADLIRTHGNSGATFYP